MAVDGGHVQSREEVSVHIIHASDVVNISSVVEQVSGLIWDKVSVDGGCQDQVPHHRGWCRRTQYHTFNQVDSEHIQSALRHG